MAKLTIDGVGEFEVADGTRLVNAIEDNGGDILHRCGGFARCTTCRVEFLAGEPDQITEAEANKLAEKQLDGVRLSCQIQCDHDMHVRPLQRFSESGLTDPGPRPQDTITPEPVWKSKSYL